MSIPDTYVDEKQQSLYPTDIKTPPEKSSGNTISAKDSTEPADTNNATTLAIEGKKIRLLTVVQILSHIGLWIWVEKIQEKTQLNNRLLFDWDLWVLLFTASFGLAKLINDLVQIKQGARSVENPSHVEENGTTTAAPQSVTYHRPPARSKRFWLWLCPRLVGHSCILQLAAGVHRRSDPCKRFDLDWKVQVLHFLAYYGFSKLMDRLSLSKQTSTDTETV